MLFLVSIEDSHGNGKNVKILVDINVLEKEAFFFFLAKFFIKLFDSLMIVFWIFSKSLLCVIHPQLLILEVFFIFSGFGGFKHYFLIKSLFVGFYL
jgi:hypothetical protein